MILDNGEFWGAVHVISSQEKRAVDNLRKQGYQALYPFFIEHQLRGDPIPRPLFPGYVFILLDARPWASINSTRGVIRLLASPQGVPDRLAEEDVDSLQRCLVPNPRGGEPLLAEGTVVKMLRGAAAGQEAVVNWSRDRRLGLFYSFFNRQCEVEFAVEDVEVVAVPD